MSVTYTAEGVFVTKTCGECGIQFGLQEGFDNDNQRNGGTWYCPNGHGRVYTEPEVKKLERQLTREMARHDQTKANLQGTKRTLIAERGHRTRLKNRIKNGVCPCCNRSFQNLYKHMKSQHPDYAKKERAEQRR